MGLRHVFVTCCLLEVIELGIVPFPASRGAEVDHASHGSCRQ